MPHVTALHVPVQVAPPQVVVKSSLFTVFRRTAWTDWRMKKNMMNDFIVIFPILITECSMLVFSLANAARENLPNAESANAQNFECLSQFGVL